MLEAVEIFSIRPRMVMHKKLMSMAWLAVFHAAVCSHTAVQALQPERGVAAGVDQRLNGSHQKRLQASGAIIADDLSHTAQGQQPVHTTVLRKHGYPDTAESQIAVFSGEDVKAMLQEDIDGMLHLQFSTGVHAVQMPAGDIVNPNSATLDCRGGYTDFRNVRVAGTLEEKVCTPSQSAWNSADNLLAPLCQTLHVKCS
jgi:hypothetical protein